MITPLRRVLTIILVLAGASLLAYLLRDLVARLVLEPLLYLFWIAGLYYRLVPETIHWAMLLLIFLAAIWFSQRERRVRPPRERLLQTEHETRLELWLSWIQARNQGNYSRWRLANRLAYLTIEQIAQQQGISAQQAREALETGEPDLPGELREYLLAGLSRNEYGMPPQVKKGRFSRSRNGTEQREAEALIEYLEGKRGL